VPNKACSGPRLLAAGIAWTNGSRERSVSFLILCNRHGLLRVLLTAINLLKVSKSEDEPIERLLKELATVTQQRRAEAWRHRRLRHLPQPRKFERLSKPWAGAHLSKFLD
jgi:hypothetical protein